jgi:hypothetical protein
MPRKMKHPAVIADHVAKVHGCELAPFLACCGGHGATEIHHVLRGNANRIDAPWNIVSVCKSAHDWCHRETVQGMVICWHVIHLRGELEIDAIRQQWGRNPLQRIDQVASGVCSAFRFVARNLLEVYGAP